MQRFLPLGFALALFSRAFAACTMDFDQFQPSGAGGAGGAGGNGGSGASDCPGECCTYLDCPVLTDPCKRATCTGNVCGEAAVEDGAEPDMQTAGDCKKNVCEGGVLAGDFDDTDTFDDGNDCTVDTCSNGLPQSSPENPGTACNSEGGKLCDGDSKCVVCLADMDCAAAAPECDPVTHGCILASCGDGEENGNETDQDCGGADCSPCADNKKCGGDGDCTSQVCGNGTCSAPTCGDGKKNGDEGDTDCGEDCPSQCDPNAGCNVDGDCKGDDCTGVNGSCVPNCQDGVKNNNETDDDCGGGTCDDCDNGEDCAGSNANCKSGYCGPGDKCAPKGPTGTVCAADNECASNTCRDGVCCNNGCGGLCRSCAVAGSVGTCSNIPANTDPGNECNAGGNTVCDGNAACKKDKGTACGGDGECANGECTDGFCCESACGGLCQACSMAKTGMPNGTCAPVTAGTDPENECGGGLDCDGNGACEPKQANGTACLGGGECNSNFCIDTVCCDTVCAGLCKSCNVAGSAGTCSDVPAGTDPANECNGATPNCAVGGVCGP